MKPYTRTEAKKLAAELRSVVPCRQTTGHGESCTEGWLCGHCTHNLMAADAIDALLKELGPE